MKLLIRRRDFKNGSNLVGAIEFPFESDTPITEDLLKPAQDEDDLRVLKGLVTPGIKFYHPVLGRRVGPEDGWDYLEALERTNGIFGEIQVTEADLKRYGIEDGDEVPEGEPVAGDPDPPVGDPDMDEFYATTHFTKGGK